MFVRLLLWILLVNDRTNLLCSNFKPTRDVILPCTSIWFSPLFYQVGLMLAGMGGSIDVFRMVISNSYNFCLQMDHPLFCNSCSMLRILNIVMVFVANAPTSWRWNKLNFRVRKQRTYVSHRVNMFYYVWFLVVRQVHAGRKDKLKSWKRWEGGWAKMIPVRAAHGVISGEHQQDTRRTRRRQRREPSERLLRRGGGESTRGKAQTSPPRSNFQRQCPARSENTAMGDSCSTAADT